MNVHFHFSSTLRANSYVIGPEGGGDAILVDPGEMDVALLRIIEGNGYYVSSVLITQPHPGQVHGVRTLLKIYDAKLYGNSERIYDCVCHRLEDGQRTELCGKVVEAMNLTSDPQGPLCYRIENLIFSGLLLTAGNSVLAADRRHRAQVEAEIDSRILSLGDDVLLLPGAGPPSSVRSERALRESANERLEPRR